MSSATVTAKGQVTIPKKIRELLRLKPGDRIDFILEEDGRITVRAATLDVGRLEGLLHRPGRPPVSLDDMDAAIARHGKRP